MVRINKKNIVVCILLSIVTLGVYGIYWMYILVKNIRIIQNNTRKCSSEMLCLIFVPFYSIYWWYTRGEKVKQIFSKNDWPSLSNGVVYLILSIFGFGIVSMSIMQSDFNSLKLEEKSEQKLEEKSEQQNNKEYKHLIELENLCKTFDDNDVLKNINLYINENEFLTLLGPSGCGKTTLLRIIAGLETPTSGKVSFEGQDLAGVPAYERKVNTVFQRYALFPHLDVFDNIAFGLNIKKLPKDEIERKVKRVLELVNLKGFENRTISSLSGGQQQRIAIARAIVNEPKVLLLDEPLAALDLKLRQGMQLELKNMQRELGITFIYVTHDQEEALTMSDTVVVMKEGTIQQIGTPTDIYNEPKNAYVADFIGESNIIDGIMKKDCLVNILDTDFECVDTGFSENEDVDVVIRPEDIYILEPDKGKIPGTVESVIFKGVHYEMVIDTGSFKWLVHDTAKYEVGSQVSLFVKPFDIHIMKKS